ncbi:MAG: spermidine synthase [Rhodoferax sp.]
MASKKHAPALPEVQFSDERNLRHLHLGGTPWVQGSMFMDKPDALVHDYVQRMMGWLLLCPQERLQALDETHVMQLGLGAGSLCKFCVRVLGVRTTVIEINPQVVLACRGWFKLPAEGPKLQIVLDDAQRALDDAQWWSTVDVLQVDLYDQQAAAPVLDSAPFYTQCRRVLAPGGCMTVNVFGRASSFARSVESMAAAFGADAIWAFKPTREGNTVVMAQHTPTRPARAELAQRADLVQSRWGLPANKWLRVLSPLNP